MRGTQPSTTILPTEETPYTSVKMVPKRDSNEQRTRQVDPILRAREASQEDALASTRHFFASVNGQNQVVTLELPEEVPTVATEGTTAITSTIPTTSATITITGTEAGSLGCFFLINHLLGPLQQLPIDHECGYREFQRVGQMFLPQMAVTLERVAYLDLPY